MSVHAPIELLTSATPEESVVSEPDHVVLNSTSRHGLSASGKAGLILTITVLLFGLLGPVVISQDPNRQDLANRFQPPIWSSHQFSHPFGTDQLGRDVLARSAQGTRASLAIGLTVTLITMTIGVILGLLAGSRGGLLDRALTFCVNVQLAIPVIVFAIAMSALFSPSIPVVVLVLSTVGWVTYQRVVRERTRSLKRSGFVEASQALGASQFWVTRHHILPNLINPVIVLVTQQLAAVILFEAALSYLGLGVPPSTITLGGMVASGREAMMTAWWVVGIPGAIVAVLATGWLLLGDGVQEWLDPTKGG